MLRSFTFLATVACCALIPANAAADTITVVPESAGANCANGGVKITVTPTPPPPPDPAPDPQISYVCSGLAGDPGPAGPPGDPGADGQPGADGSPGADGLDGLDGSNGENGSNGSSSSASSTSPRPSCDAANRVISMRLPARYRNGKIVAVTVHGRRRTATVARHAVHVDLRGLGCGSYPVVVQRRGVRPVVRILTLNRTGKIGSSPVVG